jgi:hypothetical protein
MRRSVCILLLASVFASANGKAEARPPELRDLVEAPYPAGCSEYRSLLWKFYRAELWSDAKALPGNEFGLALTYLTDFTREELVKSSVGEMSRISRRKEQAFAEVGAELRQAFRDVARGDRITAWRAGSEKLYLYVNGQETGVLTRDVDLFLAIWLGEETRHPNGRKALLSGRCDG